MNSGWWVNKKLAAYHYKRFKRFERKVARFDSLINRVTRGNTNRNRWREHPKFSKYIGLVSRQNGHLRAYFIAKGLAQPHRVPRLKIMRFPRLPLIPVDDFRMPDPVEETQYAFDFKEKYGKKKRKVLEDS
jgi:hypothetical protein